MEQPRRHLSRSVAKYAGVAAAVSLVGGAIAMSRVKINYSYDDEILVLLMGISFMFSLVVCGIALVIAAVPRTRDQRGFEVVLPHRARGITRRL